MRHVVGSWLVTLLAVVIAVPVMAQGPGDPSQRARRWEMSLSSRYQFQKTVDGAHGSSIDFDDDFSWGFGFGFNLTERFQLGGDFGWNYIDYNATVIDGINPSLRYGYSNTASTGSALFTGEFYLMPKRLTPFANGAVGWGTIDSNIVAGFAPGCYWDPWYGYICGTYPLTYGSDAVVYRFGAGVRYDLGRNFIMKLGYNSQWADPDNSNAIRMDQIRLDVGGLF